MLWLRSVAFNFLFYMMTIVMVLLAVPCLFLPRRCAQWTITLWAYMTLGLLRVVAGTGYELRGLQHIPPGGCLIAAKHHSMWDTIIFSIFLDDPAFVLKRELLQIPFYGWYVYKAGMIAVDRSAGASAIRNLVGQSRKAIEAGRPIIIFPEGTRMAPGATPDYKPGIAALYRQLDVPCVPVAVNSGIFWPRRKFLRKPGTIVLECLPPIPPGLDRESFMRELETAIEGTTNKLLAEGTS